MRANNPEEVDTGPEDSLGFHTRVPCFEEAVDSSMAAGHSFEVAAGHRFEVTAAAAH